MIADPMANLSDDPTGGGGGGGVDGMDGDNNAISSSSREIIDGIPLQYNYMRIDRIQSIMGIVSGCVVGIMGVTGLQGFVYFLFLHFFVCVMIWGTKMNCDLTTYTKQSWYKYVTASMYASALSFTLFWTFFYGLVYLY